MNKVRVSDQSGSSRSVTRAEDPTNLSVDLENVMSQRVIGRTYSIEYRKNGKMNETSEHTRMRLPADACLSLPACKLGNGFAKDQVRRPKGELL